MEANLLIMIVRIVRSIEMNPYQKKSLVFDLIECYRVWADETVVGLFAARKVKQDMFDKLQNGLTLNKSGKAVLMEQFGAYLDEGIRYRNRNIKRRDTVQLDFHRMANEWIGRVSDEDDRDTSVDSV
jgi:CRISPR-associated protein Cas1